jgi:hypothetical protein
MRRRDIVSIAVFPQGRHADWLVYLGRVKNVLLRAGITPEMAFRELDFTILALIA